jgi:hypothetical protein
LLPIRKLETYTALKAKLRRRTNLSISGAARQSLMELADGVVRASSIMTELRDRALLGGGDRSEPGDRDYVRGDVVLP